MTQSVTMATPPGTYDTKSLAARLKISPKSLREQLSRGYIRRPDGYVGQSPWWDVEATEAWIKQRPSSGWARKDEGEEDPS